MFRKKYQVKPNTVGYLYRDNVFVATLSPGIYKFWDFRNRTELFILPEPSRLLSIVNQEVLTKDNIALRFSFYVVYRIVDGVLFLKKFTLDRPINAIISEAEQRLLHGAQIHVRKKIS
ncbi:MAG: hypothetical protein SFU91_06560 [Chloroherpetonaceae bacterium]|nr:hypothetical protein [Chloroherpetonaceae bacterium]